MKRSVRQAQVLLLVALGLGALLLPSPNPASAASVAALTAGSGHTCALTSGAVQCWGSNEFGQLGIGSFDSNIHLTPTRVPGLSGVIAIDAGDDHTCALISGGGVKCWGRNLFGQLGDASPTDRPSPVDVSSLTSGMTAISAGGTHTCALTTAGGVKCWGRSYLGTLGDGLACGTEYCTAPVNVTGISSGATAIGAGGNHTCAIVTGGLRCWGYNALGQLGDNRACGTSHCDTPVNVSGLSSNVEAVAVGEYHTCAKVRIPPVIIGSGTSASGLLAAHILRCWGNNDQGELGDGTTMERHVPVDVCADVICAGVLSGVGVVGAGFYETCVRTSGGGLKCWGDNRYGQLGKGSMTPHHVPVDVPSLTSGVGAIALGIFHTCAATGTSVRCWGQNSEGQLGATASDTCFNGQDNVPCSTTPLVVDLDSDMDGCVNSREQGGNAALGGMRNTKQFWDFFDTPTNAGVRDRIISTGDLQRLVSRFGSTQVPALSSSAALAQALGVPAPTGYNAAFDRSPPSQGGEPWDVNAPDGSIATADILFLVNQFGHSCA